MLITYYHVFIRGGKKKTLQCNKAFQTAQNSHHFLNCMFIHDSSFISKTHDTTISETQSCLIYKLIQKDLRKNLKEEHHL